MLDKPISERTKKRQEHLYRRLPSWEKQAVEEGMDDRSAVAKRLQQRVRELVDRDVLQAIQRRYGELIPPDKLREAERSPIAILPREAYQEYLVKVLGFAPSEAEQVLGHYDPEKHSAWASQLYPLTRRIVAHERLHQLAHSDCSIIFGSSLKEGVTELLARAAVGDPHFAGQPGVYPHETRLAEALRARVGQECLAKAYFQGLTAEVRRHIAATLGWDNLAQLVRLADAGRFSEAERLLSTGDLG